MILAISRVWDNFKKIEKMWYVDDSGALVIQGCWKVWDNSKKNRDKVGC